MEQQQWQPAASTSLVALAILLFLIAVTTRRKSMKGARRIPGPRGWPVLGCLPLLGTLPHQILAKFARKYGPLMLVKLGSSNVIVVSSPKIAEEFLKTHDRIWASRYVTNAAKILLKDANDIAFSEYGPRWRYAKRVFTSELLTAKRISSFQKIRKEEIMRGINDAIDRCCNGTKSIRMDLLLLNYATNIVTRMLTNDGGLNAESDRIKNSDQFHETTKDLTELLGGFYLGDYFPWLDRIDPQGLKKQMHAVAKKYDEFIQGVLDEHKIEVEAAQGAQDKVADDTAKDIIYTLLTRPRDRDGQHLTETEIKGIIKDMMLGGTDTNSTTLEWGLSGLLRNPRILEKARAELYSVVGRERLVEESDLPNLPYLNAIVKETFRLHPASPLLQRTSMGDCEIQGYKIAAKTSLLVNTYAIQRDPEVYERPLDFYPERFLGTVKDIQGLDFDLLPFGTGRRICPGIGLGLLLVQYTMALFLQTCKLSLPGNLKPEELDMEERFGMVVPRRSKLYLFLNYPDTFCMTSRSDHVRRYTNEQQKFMRLAKM